MKVLTWVMAKASTTGMSTLTNQEDIDLMEGMGLSSYRFSISWARILPKGGFEEVNFAGIAYYNRLIDALLLKGIQPFVTITHFDNPQELDDRYDGWLSSESQKDYAYFADLCFKSFGDRVKYWVTFNEPNLHATYGYRSGKIPPARCSRTFGNCTRGNSEKEPFLAAHNMILSHAAAVDIYRTIYQKEQKGSIGIVLQATWFEPISNSTADRLAAERAQSFTMNWFLDPIIHGKYPAEMETILGTILPKFSSKDKTTLNKALDFIGINHYTGYYVQDCRFSACEPGPGITRTEGYYQTSSQKNGVPMGEIAALEMNVYPEGMEKMVIYVKERYNNTPMFITENGYGESTNLNCKKEECLYDFKRMEYMHSYLDSLLRAVRKGADVRGYFAWSLLDNFEWLKGYTIGFGLHHVDYATLKRAPKLSASWYKKFIAKHKTNTLVQKNNRQKENWYKQWITKAKLKTLLQGSSQQHFHLPEK
ncbi:Beta-glucosidase [Quillaja saponaria]|uniref:Beta-glucosidase n=1 Tax=Quillaja saponaria TaxID=32244 RepID=A0AAD7PTH4_QUISA|nr:Beta-glucosidase [Quillaja saponaria]